jgi:glutamine synthetase
MLLDNVYKMQQVYSPELAAELSKHNKDLIERLANHISQITLAVQKMVAARKTANKLENEREKALAYEGTVLPYFDTIRYHADELELIVDDDLWSLPKYREMLFIR